MIEQNELNEQLMKCQNLGDKRHELNEAQKEVYIEIPFSTASPALGFL